MVTLPDMTTDPREAFWRPGIDDGVYLLSDPQPHWRQVDGANITSIAISEHRKINNRWREEEQKIIEERRYQAPVEYNSVPVVVTGLTVADTHLAVGDKWLLSGAAGERVAGASFRAWKRAGRDPQDWNDRFTNHFDECQQGGGRVDTWDSPVSGLDFVFEARNLKNYYHFKKELFCNLTLLDEVDGFDGQVQIVCEDPTVPGFVQRFLDDIFPELSGRVHFVTGPKTFRRALTVWQCDFAYFQSSDHRIDGLFGAGHDFADGQFSPGKFKSLRHNGYHRAVRLLRERSLALSGEAEQTDWPRKFWVGRRPTPGHDRSVKNEDRIIAELARNGFGVVYFEDLTPLRQIRVMNDAQTMASFHGAGFTNLMYAAPDARVVELGTLQSGMLRLGDFAGLAHASRADYSVAIADYEYDGNRVIPPMRGHGLYPVRITDQGVDRLVEHILDQA
jgi:hypothetical protein